MMKFIIQKYEQLNEKLKNKKKKMVRKDSINLIKLQKLKLYFLIVILKLI